MGYTTDFSGSFGLDRQLTKEHEAYLEQFAGSRRMRRDASKTEQRADLVREAVGLPVGDEGAYFVGESGYSGQDNGDDVLDHNKPPAGQPGLWCQWTPDEGGQVIGWNGGEKFYHYVEWLEYLLEHFLVPWGYQVDGAVEWVGEDPNDRGRILVERSQVRVQRATFLYEDVE